MERGSNLALGSWCLDSGIFLGGLKVIAFSAQKLPGDVQNSHLTSLQNLTPCQLRNLGGQKEGET